MVNVLICGDAELFAEEVLRRLAERYRVIAAGDLTLSEKNKNIKIYHTSPQEEQFHQLFDVYSFQAVYYFSGYADGGDGIFGESQQLEQVIRECGRSRVEKLIVLSTVESQNFVAQYGKQGELLGREYATDRAFQAAQLEALCQYYAERMKVHTVLLRVPYLAGRINKGNFLGRTFQNMYEKKKVVFPCHAGDPIDFLSFRDLAELLRRITDETEDEDGVFSAVSGYRYTYAELEEMLRLCVPGLRAGYENRPYMAEFPEYPQELREQYGFIPVDNIMENIGQYYRVFVREVLGAREGIGEKLWAALSAAGRGLFKYAELILFFFAVEFLSRYTSESVYFKFVDVRILYIVIMGTIYGMRAGLVASLLECAALLREYSVIGMSGTLIFYNIENWIPFVVYLMAGSISGYISDKRRDALSFSKREYALLRDKYLFLLDVYHGAMENKGEYRRQILGFKDSFGKIFDAVQKLDNELPESIFFEGLKVLEDILENRSIAIYTLDSWQRYGRLAVCSNAQLTKLTKSIKIAEYQQMYDVASSGGVWKNTELVQDLPMYACGIFREEKMALLVVIWKVEPEQYGMHYMNIFKILCGLVQTSFLRAMEYERLSESRIYYPDTHIVYPERMRQLAQVQEAMREAGVADYVLLRFEDKDKKKIDEAVTGIIRASDILGTDEEGNVYLLLVQMNRKNFSIVGKRLEERGLAYDLIELDDGKAG